MNEQLSPANRAALVEAQRSELTEHYIYKRLARIEKDPENSRVLEAIAADELKHYEYWKEITGEEVKPRRRTIVWLAILARVFGLIFAVRFMERGEERAQTSYAEIADAIGRGESIADDEGRHEQELIDILDEERLRYIGSVVRGLNDALVELTGALAGFTFAFAEANVIAMAGLITGVSASLSMAGSEYLARKAEPDDLKPLKAAVMTGSAYIATVAALVAPYLVLSNVYLCLGVMLAVALAIIAVFNYYVSVAQDRSFWRRFGEMAVISLGIAAVSFGIGALVRGVLGVGK